MKWLFYTSFFCRRVVLQIKIYLSPKTIFCIKISLINWKSRKTKTLKMLNESTFVLYSKHPFLSFLYQLSFATKSFFYNLVMSLRNSQMFFILFLLIYANVFVAPVILVKSFRKTNDY